VLTRPRRLWRTPARGSPAIRISVVADTPADAVALAEALSESYIDWFETRQEQSGLGELGTERLYVLDPPNEKDVVAELENVRAVMVSGMVIGLVAGVLVALAIPVKVPETKQRRGRPLDLRPWREDDAVPTGAPPSLKVPGARRGAL
jgi:hypothetical protein